MSQKKTSPVLGGIVSCSASDFAYSYTFLHAWCVCLSSVVYQTHSCTLLIAFNGFRCHMAGTLVDSSDTLCQMPWKGRFAGQPPSQIAKPSILWCHVVNRSEEIHGLATAILLFAKLLHGKRLFILSEQRLWSYTANL